MTDHLLISNFFGDVPQIFAAFAITLNINGLKIDIKQNLPLLSFPQSFWAGIHF
jgi:hypothetical protein